MSNENRTNSSIRYRLNTTYKLLSSLFFLLLFTTTSADSNFSIEGSGAVNVDAPAPGTTVSILSQQSGTIADLDVTVVLTGDRGPCCFGIAWSDSTITISHLGTTVVLFPSTDLGEAEVVDVVFDDEGSLGTLRDLILTTPGNSPGGHIVEPVIGGHYNPEELLSAFDGLPLAGLWELNITDNFVPNEGDELIFWGISGAINRKIDVCHLTNSKKKPEVMISISENALDAHLSHGDTLGSCNQ